MNLSRLMLGYQNFLPPFPLPVLHSCMCLNCSHPGADASLVCSLLEWLPTAARGSHCDYACCNQSNALSRARARARVRVHATCIPNCSPPIVQLNKTKMTLSPLKNILLMNRSLLTPFAPPLPFSVHISFTFSRTMLQWRSNALTRASSLRLFRHEIST